MVGCADDQQSVRERGEGWDYQRIDLWADPPIDEASGAPAVRESEQFGSLHGPERAVLQVTGMIQGLVQKPGSVLTKQLELGENSTFQFHPLPFGGTRCECTFRVSIEEAPAQGQESGDRVLVAEFEMPKDLRFGPQQAVVSLSRWDRHSVRLILEVKKRPLELGDHDPAEETAVLWAGPEITTLRTTDQLALAGQDQRLNVLLVVADTLRADALGTWGRDPSVTPTLDALAAESQVWTRAFSSLNSTNPSFASMLTGLYAKNHGIYDFKAHLPQSRTTLAERFQAEGYATMAVLAARHLGAVELEQGFDDSYKTRSVFTGSLVVDQTMRWLDFHGRQPFFAMVHLFDAHMPHTPPMPYAEGYVPLRRYGLGPVGEWTTFHTPGIPAYEKETAGGGATDLYLAEVAYLDRQIDRLLGYLEARGLLDETIVVFTADHGENLLDHGIQFDHRGLFDTTTHVPLMIRWPHAGNRGPTDALVQNMDLFPTLLAGAGLQPQPEIDALSLIATDRGAAGSMAQGRRAVFSEHANREGESVRTSDFRWVEYRDSPSFGDAESLFDLGVAEDLRIDVKGDHPSAAQRLSTALSAWRNHTPYSGEAVTGTLDQAAIEQLRALGYVVN